LALRCRFGMTDAPTIAVPEPGETTGDRLSTNKAQLLHDMNLAVLLFVEDNPTLPAHYRRRAWRRVAGRSWKWARREVRRPFWSRELALCLAAQLPWWAHESCGQLLEVFRGTGQVRSMTTVEPDGH
jgi:hypothetical protein